jgi:hypothetical protein
MTSRVWRISALYELASSRAYGTETCEAINEVSRGFYCACADVIWHCNRRRLQKEVGCGHDSEWRVPEACTVAGPWTTQQTLARDLCPPSHSPHLLDRAPCS